MKQRVWHPPNSLTHPDANNALLLAREIFGRFSDETENETENEIENEIPQIVVDCSDGQQIPNGKFLAKIQFNNKKEKLLARKAFKGFNWSWDEEREICIVHKNRGISQLNNLETIDGKFMNNKIVDANAKENGLCVRTSSDGIAAIIFDKNIHIHHVSEIERWKEDKKNRKWYTIKNLIYKKFNILSHMINYGVAITIDGQYNDNQQMKYFIKANGGAVYSFIITVIFDFENDVKAIIQDLKLIHFGFNEVKFKTSHLNEIENEFNKIIKNMPKVWSHLQNRNKTKIDALKISFDDKMKRINKKYCNNCGHKIKKKSQRHILCAGCRSIYYCCWECLKNEWHVHRQRCKNNRLTFNKYLSKNKAIMFDWK